MYKNFPSSRVGALLVVAALASREARAVPPPAATAGAWVARTDFPGFIEQVAVAGSDIYLGMRAGLLKSSDRGQHWQPVAARGDLGALWGRSPDEVYVASAGVASRSDDRGQTWHPIAAPAGAIVTGIWGTGTRELYALGRLKDKPVVLYSEDAGNTIVTRDIGLKGGFLKAIGGTGPDQVFIGGTNDNHALLYSSVDKGKTWKKLSLPVDHGRLRPNDWESINGVCFSSSGVLFVATSYSVFASKDRGVHWKRGIGTTTEELLALACQGSEVFAGGRGPRFVHSADEGKTWTTNELDQYFAGTAAEVDTIAVAATGDVYVGGVASFNPAAGALYRRGALASASVAKYPGTDAGARQLLTDIRTGDAKALTATLKPKMNDYQAVFSGDFASKAEKAYETLWAGGRVVITADPANTELRLMKATRDDLANWTPQVAADFPGGYKQVASFFKPGLIVYRWRYTKPGDTLGMAFDGLVFVDNHWAWFPKPWQVKD